MRISLITFFLVLCFQYPLLGQIQISGVVRDTQSQQALPGVTVYVHDLKRGTITDAEGKYVLKNFPRGKFLIEFKSIGHASFIQVVNASNSMELNVSLNSAITELTEVVISGVSYSTELKRNPIPITTINRDALEANTSMNIIDNISRKPGVDQISTGPAISKPVIRGLSYNRIITLYDGVRQEGQQWGDEHGVEIDEFSVDRVEIIKGAGSLLYGSDGLGGVINFLAPNPVHEGNIESRVMTNYQSNNSLMATSLMNTGNLHGFYWLGNVTQKAARSYSNRYDGIVFNSGFREIDFSVTAGTNRSWGYTQLAMSQFNQNIGLVEGERDEAGKFTRIVREDTTEILRTVSGEELKTYHLFIPKQQILHQRISSVTNFLAGNTRLQLTIAYQRNRRKEYGNVLNPSQEDLYFDLNTLSYGLTAYLPELKGWAPSIGMSGMYQQNKNRGLEFLIPQYDAMDWGGVFFIKKNY